MMHDVVVHRLGRPRFLFALSVFVVVVGLMARSQLAAPVAVETLSIGVPALEQSALLYVAEERGLLAARGLQVEIKSYDSGLTSLRALLQGEVDIAVAAEYPVVRTVFQQKQVRVVATIDRFENDYIIMRANRGISVPSDLKGKRIGVTLNTINDFFLGRFLDLHGVAREDVTIVDVAPARFVEAVVAGEVDALVAWQPYIYRIQQTLRDVVVWPAQSDRTVYGVLVCRDDWLAEHKDAVSRLLQALSAAEDYVAQNPAEAKEIVRKRLNYDDAYVENIWPDHRFGVSLDFSLIVAMNDEARWLMRNELMGTDAVLPDFRDYIYGDGLRAVRPDAIDLSR